LLAFAIIAVTRALLRVADLPGAAGGLEKLPSPGQSAKMDFLLFLFPSFQVGLLAKKKMYKRRKNWWQTTCGKVVRDKRLQSVL